MFRLPVSWAGIVVERVLELGENMLVVEAVSTSLTARCPTCGESSQHIHSYYLRSPQDLPVSGYSVRLHLRARRFRCQNQGCSRKTFVERLPEVVPLYSQRTTRLTATFTLFAIALSGEAGGRLLSQIGMATSPDTLLRLAKGTEAPSSSGPALLGVDDFAFRRGSTYGTILVDLSTHQPIDLLPERTSEALAAWLKTHPGVQWISRDRSGDYAQGAREGAPEAQQIVDRWHVLKNWREVLERVLGREYARLKQRQIDSGVSIRPRYKKVRSSSEVAASQASRARRLARYEEVMALWDQGKSFTAIAAQLHMSPTTVSKFVHAGAFPERVPSPRNTGHLTLYLPYLKQRVQEGNENASALWRELQGRGFTGGYKMVNIWLREYLQQPGHHSSERAKVRRHLFQLSPLPQPAKERIQNQGDQNPPTTATCNLLLEEPLPSPRRLVWLLLRNPEHLNDREQQLLSFICQERAVHLAHTLAQRFVAMVQHRQVEHLDSWLEAGLQSGIPDVQTFAEGLQKEYAAVKAALSLPYSNGPVEGLITKLKYIKRSLYGRGNFELLRQRFLHAA
ncbi:MAG: ISL3 family transposase [Ktedonobacteraceae bacterium]|nr:ISL3 family transposase [Ktedonobacteraceae bacterium]